MTAPVTPAGQTAQASSSFEVPEPLLQAVSARGGGKLALVIGAGCSVEAPTSVPAARRCSAEIHRRLVADGILVDGECGDPEDLSALADVIFAKQGTQRALVERFCDEYDLKLASPNDGYLIAAALLAEQAISSVVTLNFDLALSTALGTLGVGSIVGVIESPEQLGRQRAVNVYYLHRNVNAPTPDEWVLRTQALDKDWQDHWESIIATNVLATPVVAFAGLGTPVAVLLSSTERIRGALPGSTTIFQVDVAERSESRFFAALNIEESAYIRSGWCAFMDALSQRLAVEHIARIADAAAAKVSNDGLQPENLSSLLNGLQQFGVVKLGQLRAHWLLHEKAYCPSAAYPEALVADLLLAIALLSRESGAEAVLEEHGVVLFVRHGRISAAYFVVSGAGHRGRPTLEALMRERQKRYRRAGLVRPSGVIVAGSSDPWQSMAAITPPADVIRGTELTTDIVAPDFLPMTHVSEIRSDVSRITSMVP